MGDFTQSFQQVLGHSYSVRTLFTAMLRSTMAASESSPASGKWATEIEAEQVRLLYNSTQGGLLSVSVSTGIVTVALWNVVSPVRLLSWATLVAGLLILFFVLTRRFQQQNPSTQDMLHWRSVFVFGFCLDGGLSWGSVGLFCFPTDSLPHQLLLAFVLGEIVAAAAVDMAPVLSAYAIFLVSMLLPTIVQLFLQGNRISIAMALVGLSFVGILLPMARRAHAFIMQSLFLRFENLDLIQGLSQAKDQTEQINMALQQEVAERKRAEAQISASLTEKEALLKEIHHRVKNNLQVISSLLRLQARTIDNEQAQTAFEESQNRVRSMALIHEKLYQSGDLARIDFAAYSKELANELLRVYQQDGKIITVNVNVQDTFLSMDTAVPCSLIVSELVSNALKYAFPDRNAGEISIDFHQSQDASCTLIVRDTGGGFPPDLDFQSCSSLGLRLVNTLTQQLGGTISLHNESGAVFTLILPLSIEDNQKTPNDI